MTNEIDQSDTTLSADRASSPWLTAGEAAARARCGPKTIYREVSAGRLRAARVGGRRELRLLPEWVDEWLTRQSSPVDASATIARRSV
jgi:excisionase family DNA binding protein